MKTIEQTQKQWDQERERFRKEREAAGISQGKFASWYGLKSYHTVSNWERGATRIPKFASLALRMMISQNGRIHKRKGGHQGKWEKD